MRYEKQKWDDISVYLEIVALGVGQTGLSPEVYIFRNDDSQWLQTGGGSWGAGVASNTMTEVDAANLPGLYIYAVPAARLSYPNGGAGYVARCVEGVNSVLEHVYITQEEDTWDEARADHTDSNTFGEGVLMQTALTGSIAAGSFAAGAIDAAALATDAVAEIADGVWNEPIAAHTTDDTYGGMWFPLVLSLVTREGEVRGLFTADAVDATGLKFYAPNLPVVGRASAFAGRLGVILRIAGTVDLCRITTIADDGDEYFGVTDLDGAALAAFAIGDQLVATNRNDPTVDEIMEEPMGAHTTLGTFGDDVNRILALRQSNVRVVYDTWNANGEPTHGYVYIYDSKSALEADSDPWAGAVGSYEFDGTYDASLQLTEYTSTRES